MKKIVLLVIACMAGLPVFSQRFVHGIGFSTFIDHTSRYGSIASFSLSYAIRYNVMETDKMTVSVGIPLSVGGSGESDSNMESYYDAEGNIVYYYTRDEDDGTRTKPRGMVDIPLIINLNFAGFSSLDNKSSVGFFVGGGLAYHYGPVNVKYKDRNGGSFTDSTTQHAVGPIGNLGMRIGLGKKKNGAIEIKGSYMKSLTKRQPDIYGISLLYILPKTGKYANSGGLY
ncbi:hypothetical protein QFZ51_001282 [Chitinophaga sp. W3I9]|uniref:hypothetical protein n=1 Tax=Chitinophaga sp. W3I9 TaxID=3373924 RepID=UPI003D1E3A1E